MTPIRIMIVDDSASVREGLAISLGAFPDLELVAEASNGAEAVRLSDEVRPDVILMDLAMPGLDGVHATRMIREAHPETRIMVLTGLRDPTLIQSALRAGAKGYLFKNVSVAVLVNAIRAVHTGLESGGGMSRLLGSAT